MVKSKEKINFYTIYKYQTLPINTIYIFTKLPLFSDKLIICQNIAIYRNFFFILLLSLQAFSIILTFLTMYTPSFINNHTFCMNISLFFISWLPSVVTLVIAYITIDDYQFLEVGNFCIYNYNDLFAIFRAYLYAVYFFMYLIFLIFIGKTIKKTVLEERGDMQGYQAYKQKLQIFYIIFIMFIFTAAFLILYFFRNLLFVSFLQRILSNVFEGFLPILVCYANCLSAKQISYIFRCFCCRKEEVTTSETEDFMQNAISLNGDE